MADGDIFKFETLLSPVIFHVDSLSLHSYAHRTELAYSVHYYALCHLKNNRTILLIDVYVCVVSLRHDLLFHVPRADETHGSAILITFNELVL